jgi:hypothetical protein
VISSDGNNGNFGVAQPVQARAECLNGRNQQPIIVHQIAS